MQWQTRTTEINGVSVTYKVTDNLKQIQIFLDDNFALAEGFFCLNAMISGLLHFREIQHAKNLRVGAMANTFCKVDEANATLNVTLGIQGDTIKQIINEVKKERDEREERI